MLDVLQDLDASLQLLETEGEIWAGFTLEERYSGTSE
jgi:hypothetical protein